MAIQKKRESSKRLKTDVETLVFIGNMNGLPMQARKNRLARERYVEGKELRCPFVVFFRFA